MSQIEDQNRTLLCAKCGAQLLYKAKKHQFHCPNCREVKCDEKYVPAPACCDVCGSALAYGAFKGMKRFFCTNSDCPIYDLRIYKDAILTSDEEEMIKIDYKGIYSFVFSLNSKKIYYINEFYNIEDGYFVSGGRADIFMELPDSWAITGILKKRITDALEFIFSLDEKEEDIIYGQCLKKGSDDRYNVARYAPYGKENVPGLIYANKWEVVLTPLMLAIANKDHRLLQELLEAGANVEEISPDKLTPLEWAACRNDPLAIKLLLEFGADINAKGADHNTPLLAAAYANALAALKYLLERGANVRLGSDIGETPLMRLAGKNSLEGIKLLLDYGAEINATQAGGQTALMLAASYNSLEAVKYLLEKGAEINIRYKNGATALMYAAAYNGVETMAILLEKGSPLEAKDNDGITPLLNAAAYTAPDAVKFLVNAGANVNALDKRHCSSLIYAAARGASELVKFLLEHGAEINIQDHEGHTALMRAAMPGEVETVKILLDYGADITIKDNNNMDALGLAYWVDYDRGYKVVPLLKEYMAKAANGN